MKKISGISSKSRKRLKMLISTSNSVLTAQLVSRVLVLPQLESARMLSRWYNAGWLKRVKRGVYWPVQLEEDPDEIAVEYPWLIANNLFAPGYIGGFSAVKHWDFSEQIFEPVVYLTVKPIAKREIILSNTKFKLKTIKPYKVFGTKTAWRKNVKIQVSDPSKTMVDFLDDPVFGGGMRTVMDFFMEYWSSEYKDIDLLIKYAGKMKNKTIFKRLGFLLEIKKISNSKTIELLRKNISSGYSKFDPLIDGACVLRKWNLKMSRSWKKEYDRKKRSS